MSKCQNMYLLVRVFDELSELGLGSRSAGRVVWRAKVDDVSAWHRLEVREESVPRIAWHVHNVIELALIRVHSA